ncbi:hypothetical protein [Flavobacterium branchiicola]|uniref:DUF4468 domain-containing protein n=1 Tax=Flavobacterium branchiicola TaxID=1114875 RepID=A0ABV9PI60_9FLAO|nr:hypothetical protein [Flavobacterium branchiicola]MBS7256138.1 hypothetical protein [Flavobacterium branchiicola]
MRKGLYIIGIVVMLIFAVWIGRGFSPGSYPYAEKYELEYSEGSVKQAVVNFKKHNQKFLVPKVSIHNEGSWELLDEAKGDYWYGFYFYYKNENQIVFIVIRSLEKNITELSFVSINDGLNIGNWKNVNDDFDYFTNKKEMEKFENSILKGIKKELEMSQSE